MCCLPGAYCPNWIPLNRRKWFPLTPVLTPQGRGSGSAGFELVQAPVQLCREAGFVDVEIPGDARKVTLRLVHKLQQIMFDPSLN